MATVYTVTVEALSPDQLEVAHEDALAAAAEFFGTKYVTAELLTYDTTTSRATYRLDTGPAVVFG